MKRARPQDGSIDRISELPKEILQRILYFLSQKEAVRTSVLSKSWRHIGCTRPNLDFSYDTFQGNRREFLSIVDKNLQRYYDQRLCVEELQLRISFGEDLDRESVSLLEKWIPLLTNMGMKKFCLSLTSEVGYEHIPRYHRLPSEVFGAESLQDLRLERFMLDRKAVARIVLFKHLKSLRLERVSVEDEIFKKIMSNCPLIETLDVITCPRLITIKANDFQNLKHFSYFGTSHERCSIEIYPPTPETIHITIGSLRFHKGADFRNLNQLHLSMAKLSWDDLSSCKFPSLESLHITYCDGLEETKLFIDAPNILYFKYEADVVPSISFATTSEEWKSDLHLMYWHPDDANSLWFLRLKELLESLSKSKISLTINQISMHGNIQENINRLVQDIVSGGGNNPAVAVEQLSLQYCYEYHLSHVSSLLNFVFSICRPRNLKGCLGGTSGQKRSEHVECLWKILMERESDDQFKHALWLQDLEDVSFEIKYRGEWRPTSLPDLPNYQEMEFTRIRFAFKWRRLHLVRDPSKKPRKPKILRI